MARLGCSMTLFKISSAFPFRTAPEHWICFSQIVGAEDSIQLLRSLAVSKLLNLPSLSRLLVNCHQYIASLNAQETTEQF
jgi:hypothetical protein